MLATPAPPSGAAVPRGKPPSGPGSALAGLSALHVCPLCPGSHVPWTVSGFLHVDLEGTVIPQGYCPQGLQAAPRRPQKQYPQVKDFQLQKMAPAGGPGIAWLSFRCCYGLLGGRRKPVAPVVGPQLRRWRCTGQHGDPGPSWPEHVGAASTNGSGNSKATLQAPQPLSWHQATAVPPEDDCCPVPACCVDPGSQQAPRPSPWQPSPSGTFCRAQSPFS